MKHRITLCTAALVACAWAAGAAAQTSPGAGAAKPAAKGAASAPVPAAAAAAPSAALGVPVGSGPGVHSPNSPITPLAARADVVPWSVLTRVTTRTDKNRILPVFEPAQTQLSQKTQRVQGFMVALDPGEKQTHFLLSSVPLSCSFCTPGGPESMVEVLTRTPVRITLEPVVVEGRFQVLADDPYGLYYRLSEAQAVK